MRNIDIPGAKEIFSKSDELLSTFTQNRGYVKAMIAITEGVRENYFFEKMDKMRANNNARIMREKYEGVDAYEESAREYYAKYGTSGEF